jgi:hypothetical protein
MIDSSVDYSIKGLYRRTSLALIPLHCGVTGKTIYAVEFEETPWSRVWKL